MHQRNRVQQVTQVHESSGGKRTAIIVPPWDRLPHTRSEHVKEPNVLVWRVQEMHSWAVLRTSFHCGETGSTPLPWLTPLENNGYDVSDTFTKSWHKQNTALNDKRQKMNPSTLKLNAKEKGQINNSYIMLYGHIKQKKICIGLLQERLNQNILYFQRLGGTHSLDFRSCLQSESSSSPRGQPQGQDGGELSL